MSISLQEDRTYLLAMPKIPAGRKFVLMYWPGVAKWP